MMDNSPETFYNPLMPNNVNAKFEAEEYANDSRGRGGDRGGSRGAALAARYFWLITFLVGTLGESVGNKRVGLAAPHYPLALVELLAFAGITFYPIIVAGAILSGYISRSQIFVAWWKPAVVGICFVLHDVLLKVGSRGEFPGILIQVLMKLSIPCSMCLSMPRRTLGCSYRAVHWVSLVLLLAGVIVTVLGHLRHLMDSAHPEGEAFPALLVALSVVPLAAAFVLLEMWLKGEDKHVFPVAFWMWVCMYMVPLASILAPASALLSGLPFKKILANLVDGITCFVTGVGPTVGSTKAEVSPPDCPAAQGFWWATLLFIFAANISIPMCTRYGSATLLWVVRAATLPLGGILFARPELMGTHAMPMPQNGWLGLALVTAGVLLFNSQDPAKRD